MTAAVAISRGSIAWNADLASSTATTAYPSGSSVGVAVPSTYGPGDRVHVRLSYNATGNGSSPSMSTDIHLYGMDSALGTWAFLGSMNGGASLTVGARNTTSTIVQHEYFVIGGGQLGATGRLMTRCINPQGTGASVSTWIGFEVL